MIYEKLNKYNESHTLQSYPTLTYHIFMLWVFILIARPQDIFAFLIPFRPALSFGLATLFVAFIQISKFRKRNILESKQGKLFIGLVIVMVISIPFAYYRRGAFEFLFTFYSSNILFYILLYKLIDSKEKIESIIFLSCVASAIYSLVSIIMGGFIGDNRLTFGNMFDPNDLAYFVISFLPLNLLFISKDNQLWKKVICTANLFLGILVILMTNSRGGFVALGAMFSVIFFSRSKALMISQKMLFIIICIISFVVLSDKININRLESITSLGQDYNIYDETGRITIWKRGVSIMLNHPLTGVGLSCFQEAIGVERRKEGLQEIWQAPHNSILQIGTEIGVMGLILFVLLSFRALKSFLLAKRSGGLEGLSKIGEIIAYGFIGNFIASMFLSQAYSIYWVFFIAVSAVIDCELQMEISPSNKSL